MFKRHGELHNNALPRASDREDRITRAIKGVLCIAPIATFMGHLPHSRRSTLLVSHPKPDFGKSSILKVCLTQLSWGFRWENGSLGKRPRQPRPPRHKGMMFQKGVRVAVQRVFRHGRDTILPALPSSAYAACRQCWSHQKNSLALLAINGSHRALPAEQHQGPGTYLEYAIVLPYSTNNDIPTIIGSVSFEQPCQSEIILPKVPQHPELTRNKKSHTAALPKVKMTQRRNDKQTRSLRFPDKLNTNKLRFTMVLIWL